jgi:outer membrane protein, heavy metal efflux system
VAPRLSGIVHFTRPCPVAWKGIDLIDAKERHRMKTILRQPHPLAWALLAASLLTPVTVAAQSAGLSLREVYAEARARNPMLQAVQAEVRARAAMESPARTLPDPEIQLGLMNFGVPGLETDMPTSMTPSLRVMQMIPTAGKLGLAGRIAERETERVEAMAEETWWEVRSRAAMAFYEVYAADRQLEVMHETIQLLQSFEQVAKAMYSSGEGRQSDVLRASVEVARMTAEVTRMIAMRQAAVARLNAVLDRPSDTPVASTSFPGFPASFPGLDTLRAWAEASRPMLERARLGVDQARTRRTLAARELWPDLTVGVEYGQRRAAGTTMGDGATSPASTERMGSVMLGVTLPIFAGRRQLQMRREAEAMEQMATAELRETRASVDARLAEVLAELERDRTLIALYQHEVLPQAEANVTSTFAGYRVGKVDFMALVDAQMTVNAYRQELHTLLANHGQMVAELEMAVGRELPSTPSAATEE